MSNTAHQRAAKDLEKAGLNRILAVTQPASSPGGNMAQVQSTAKDVSKNAMVGAQLQLAKAQAGATANSAINTDLQNKILNQEWQFFQKNPKWQKFKFLPQTPAIGSSALDIFKENFRKFNNSDPNRGKPLNKRTGVPDLTTGAPPPKARFKLNRGTGKAYEPTSFRFYNHK
jgi:hypothetical protein